MHRFLLAIGWLGCASVAVAQVPVPVGAPITVNQTLEGRQRFPSLATSPDGSTLVLWHDEVTGLRARGFADDGTAVGSERSVDPAGGSGEVVAFGEDGEFLAVWHTGSQKVVARLSAEGTLLEDPVPVASGTSSLGGGPNLSAGADGGALLLLRGDGLGGYVRTQALDENLEASGVVDVDRGGALPFWSIGPALVAPTSDGRHRVVWQRTEAWGAFGFRLFETRLVGGDGQPDGPVRLLWAPLVVEDGTSALALAVDAADRTLLVWEEIEDPQASDPTVDLHARTYRAGGSPIRQVFRLNQDRPGDQTDPAAAVLADGDFVAVWRTAQDPVAGISGRLVSAIGGAVGDDFEVAAPSERWSNDPAAAPRPGGGFWVVWSQNEEEWPGADILLRRFDR